MTGAIAFVVVFSIIVGFHEGAHFLFMKLFGVRVIRFSIGFGPVLFRKKIGETEYQIGAIPLGGYVLPLSQNLPDEFKECKEPNHLERCSGQKELNHPDRYFESKPALQRMLIYLVGPLSNLLFAFLIYFALFATIGVFSGTTTLASVNKNSPAEIAGLKAGDVIQAVEGKQVSTWDEVRNLIQMNKGAPIHFRVVRSGEVLNVTVVPKEENTEGGKRFLIGILPETKSTPLSLSESLKAAVRVTGTALGMFWDFFRKLLSGGAEKKDVGGIIMIYQATSASAQQGWLALLDLMIMLNLNLFFFNILPIPLLDGGQIYPALFESITGIKPSARFNQMWQYIGVAMLLSLFLLGTYNDIARLLFK